MILGFTNGCFDCLHAGHRYFLQECAAHCDYLIVGLNSDTSVRGLKGVERPIQSQSVREGALRNLESVDIVCIFSEDTPERLIRKWHPDILFKGGDYSVDRVVGRDCVGRVMIIPRLPGWSTTEGLKS